MAVAEPGSKNPFAEELGISRASLYYHLKMPTKDDRLRRRIETVMLENPGHGSPQVTIARGINKKRAARDEEVWLKASQTRQNTSQT